MAETILENPHHSGGWAVGLLDGWACPSSTGRTAQGSRVEARTTSRAGGDETGEVRESGERVRRGA